MENIQTLQPIILAIVGHTNTGKTSLIRTLLRNENFGVINDAAGTTRHVEAAQILANGKAIIELRDTPGLEDSIALATTLNSYQKQNYSNRECLDRLINDEKKYTDFEQEIKVLKQSLISDVLFYVIDCREQPVEKYRIELQLLSYAAKPIIPILNFVTTDQHNKEQWRQILAELNMHALVEFDTVAYNFESEKRLYEKLQTVLESRYVDLQTLKDTRQQQWLGLQQAAIERVAQLLVEVAVLKINKSKYALPTLTSFQDKVKLAEKKCLNDILDILQFSQDDIEYHNLPVTEGEWQLDLFSRQTLKLFGLDTASAAATGAVVGAGLDLMLAGISLGAASVAGAAIGASWQTGKKMGANLLAKAKRETWICADANTLTLIMSRQIYLLTQLFARGHAAQNKLVLEENTKNLLPKDWSKQLQQLIKVQRSPGKLSDEELNEHTTHLQSWIVRTINN